MKKIKLKQPLYTVGIILIAFMFSFGNTTQGTLLNDYIAKYSLIPAQQSYISSVQSLGMVLSMGLLLLSLIRLKKSLTIILAILAVSLMFMGLSTMPGYTVFLIFYFIIGLSYGQIDSLASSITADLHNGKNAALMMGILHAFIGVGGIIGPIFIQRLRLGGLEWNGVLKIFSFIALGICIANVIFYLSGRKTIDTAVKPVGGFALKEITEFMTKKNMLIVASVALYGAHQICLTFWLNRYITVGLGNSLLGPLAVSLYWVGAVASRVIVPMLGINFYKYTIWSMLSSTAILGVVLASGSAELMCVGTLIAGILGGAVIPMGINTLCIRFSKNTLIASTGTLLATSLAQMIAPLLIGIFTTEGNLYIGIVIGLVFGILSAVFSIWGKKMKEAVS